MLLEIPNKYLEKDLEKILLIKNWYIIKYFEENISIIIYYC